MASTHSAESDSAELNSSTFLGDRVVMSFPRHEVVKLNDVMAPTRFIPSANGSLVVNPSVLVFDQQDSLLTSWLLSTIGSSFLASFTDVQTARDVWIMANNLFAADSTSGSHISEAERTAVLLTGLSLEFDAIVSSASLSSEPFPFQRVVDALLECEARLLRSALQSAPEMLIDANAVEGPQTQATDIALRGGGRFSARGRGRSFHPRLQCQICSHFGHLAQKCYYRYHRDDPSPIDVSGSRRGDFVPGANRSDDDRIGMNDYFPRRPHARPGCNRFNPFVQSGSGQHGFMDPKSYSNGHDIGANRNDMGPQFGDVSLGVPYGHMAPRPRGPSGLVRSCSAHDPIIPEPSANCVSVDRSWETVHEAPLRTKPRARVFSVESSPFDSSQFVGLPPTIPELHASDYSGATAFDSNFNSTGSFVPLPVGSTSWCPDSGATYHVCKNDSTLRGSTPYLGNSSLLMGNDVSTKISSVGNTVFPTPTIILHLSNVLCVPSIRKNLLFVSQFATDNNVFFEFHPSYCVIKDIQTREILMRGQVRDGLYHFSAGLDGLSSSVHNAALQVCSPVTDVFSLWHKRLGHPADNIVKTVLANCQISFNKCHLNGVCVACQKGKSHKLPFSQSRTKYVDLFELVVSDMWGSASVPCEENLYYVSFIDMTSHFTWVYLVRRKSQAIDCFGHFQKMVFTQFGKTIKQFQSDWGGEFHAFSSVLANQGIFHRVTCPHTAVHLINRLPTSILDGKTPFQCLFGLELTYDHLRVFGCCCFPYLHPFGKHKLEFRSQPSTFLGYSLRHKGYFCLTPDGKYVPVVRPLIPTEVQLDPVSGVEVSVDSHSADRTQSNSFATGGASLHRSNSRSAVPEEAPSTTIFPFEPLDVPPVPATNTHTMVIRSKAGIFKPKALCAENVEVEPCSVAEARLVAKGCSQVPGYDFKETFSPVVKPATIRAILSVAVTKGWHLRQVDVNNAFLNGDLTDDVYMQQPPGYEQTGPNGERLVCRLTKALYGLRQAPHHILYVLVYVDDIVITGSSVDEINCFVQQLHNMFALKDMGELHYFLGIEVSRFPSGSLHLCQRKYIRELLARSSMTNAKSVPTPMVSSSMLSKDEGDPLADPTEYRSIAGALQYIVLTRPDIAYAVNRVCQFMHAPTTLHMIALKRILRYLCGTLSHSLLFQKSDRLSLIGYADANWGLDFDDRRSTTGYCVYFGHTPISWCSKKQQVVSRSMAEAEYRSLAAATSDVTWLVSLLTELQLSSVDPPTVWCDNSSAVVVAANPVLHSKFKHVELDLFFVREKVARSELVVGEVPACDQVADILTKPLSISAFTRLRHLLRVLSLEEVGCML
ncbi:hypothetical protein CXB51_032233 [Gossypium anomalum]|uniref:Integrase catalytic domain-containing protein n=1 Tax=Gossypium anomalum TaxID=47600 RepID=A0A8J5YCJ2_9ROSI|nr:hypothetical protein CXB51_032233 [Gossypium anomalum]